MKNLYFVLFLPKKYRVTLPITPSIKAKNAFLALPAASANPGPLRDRCWALRTGGHPT